MAHIQEFDPQSIGIITSDNHRRQLTFIEPELAPGNVGGNYFSRSEREQLESGELDMVLAVKKATLRSCKMIPSAELADYIDQDIEQAASNIFGGTSDNER